MKAKRAAAQPTNPVTSRADEGSNRNKASGFINVSNVDAHLTTWTAGLPLLPPTDLLKKLWWAGESRL